MRTALVTATLSLLCVPTLSVAVPPIKPTALAPLVWIDSAGKTLGRAVGNQQAFATFNGQNILVELSGQPTQTGVDSSKAVIAGNILYFTSPDCAGAAYIPDRGFLGLNGGVAIRTSTSTLVYLSATGVAGNILALSSFANGACQNYPGVFPTSGTPAVVPPIDITNAFSPPFTLK